MTSRAEKLLAEARTLLDSTEQTEKRLDEDKWAAAERLWKANREEGATHAEISRAVGRSESSVREHIQIFERSRGARTRGSFTQAYYDMKPAAAPSARFERTTRQTLRESTPEQVAEILEDPEIRRNVAKAQDLRHTEQKQRSEKAYREAIGPETADALDSQQVLTNAEAELFKSRRALRDALAILRTIDPTEIRDSWLEEFVKTFDDIAAMLELGRSLVDGESVDDAIDRILEGSK